MLTDEELTMFRRMAGIFMPHAKRKTDERYPDRSVAARFVHYTTAEDALKIIGTKRLWMRNTVCMTDYREVEHGHGLLLRLFANKAWREQFVSALDECSPNVASEAINLFDRNWVHLRNNTYIACLSEHDHKEDWHGRLSMWRAFGATTARVAIVIGVPLYSGASESLRLVFSPVAYFTEQQTADELAAVVQNIRAETAFLRTVDRATLLATVYSMLLAAATCLKHEGFSEEKEWRAIYSPGAIAPSPLMEQSIEVIGGVPQRVQMIPLDARKSADIAALDFAQIFDRLIIGPSQFPLPMYDAFVEELKKAGVSDADKRVVASTIPIRT